MIFAEYMLVLNILSLLYTFLDCFQSLLRLIMVLMTFLNVSYIISYIFIEYVYRCWNILSLYIRSCEYRVSALESICRGTI